MENNDELIILCPRCEDTVLGIYKNENLEIIKGCLCFDKIGFSAWSETIINKWNDMVIIKIPGDGELLCK